MHPLRSLRSYTQAIPPVLSYQLVSALLLGAVAGGLNYLAMMLMHSEGHVAVSTGDFKFLFTSWQGIAMLVVCLVSLYVYVGLDIFVKVAFAGRWVRGEDVTAHHVIGTGVKAMKALLTLGGLFMVIYFSVLTPLAGVGFTISLTDGFEIPTFITSVIDATPLFSTLRTVVVVILSVVGFLNAFTVHGMVLDGLSLREASRQSRMLLRKHWWNFLWRMLVFVLLELMFLLLVILLLAAVGIGIAAVLGSQDENVIDQLLTTDVQRFIMLFVLVLGAVLATFVNLLSSPFFVIRLSKFYEEYTTGEKVEVAKRPHRFRPVLVLGVLVAPALCAALAYVGTVNFDAFFPQTYDVKVIAHRACGHEGYENTAEGLAVSEAAGAWGAEIDIQRTSDGSYVVNHDDTFERVAGDSRKSYEMTLAEIRQLRVTVNPANPDGPGVPVSTYEELLDGARDHNLILFVELKGETADEKMADDAVRIATERGVVDRCVFISLKYDLIKYLADNYDVKTGYLAFGSYGDTAALDCDYLALEELATNDSLIDDVHAMDKSYLVWTVNGEYDLERFMSTEADAVITDDVTAAVKMRDTINQRGDFGRVFGVAGSLV